MVAFDAVEDISTSDSEPKKDVAHEQTKYRHMHIKP